MSSAPDEKIVALHIHVEGLVQGVGFRPFIYRLAKQHHLKGWVVNRTDGVTLKVEGLSNNLSLFVEDIRLKAPVISQIDEITVDPDFPEDLQDFIIMASRDISDETSEISPDIAVCSDCLADMKHQPHRIGYPFINCTNCGPRFSIVRDFPYDRKNTTMATFVMCDFCNTEYSDIADRRFHAQPVACNHCGPSYSMHAGNIVLNELLKILEKTASFVDLGNTVALKGTGGFHLLCDALNENAVVILRKLKKREGKPFAVMFKDIETLKRYAEVSDSEESVLQSWKRPIVILKSKESLAGGIALGLDTLGAFLPYMPLHYLLFEKLNTPAIVLTSGNIADEPIIIDNEAAVKIFKPLISAVITYDRDIYNRTDDSVVRVMEDKVRILRRSRGYVPVPIRLGFDVDGIIATGAELSNCFCLGKANRAYMSQHIGDLKNYETYSFYKETMLRFQQLFRVKPNLFAADLHPDYLSTRYARETGTEIVHVQHHHAHIASCMTENGAEGPVIGLAFDGTGLGTDGHIWGSEFLTCDYLNFTRHCHFNYMPMPGGDKASEEPWRMGISLLHQAFGRDMYELDLPFLKMIDEQRIKTIVEAIEKKINCPLSSGAGRLFDAVAAISGICVHALFHSEAPMRLESLIKGGIHDCYEFDIADTISFLPAIRQICKEISHGTESGIIAARFHNTIVSASLEMTLRIRSATGIHEVALSGGTFQNKYLFESLYNKLLNNNFTVYTHSAVPCNDGGLALGQLAVAARRRT